MTETHKISASDHPIQSVTVFKSSKAEVNRTFVVDLKTGQNKVQISDLSSNIDTESVRVSGLGQARLFDVVCTIEKKQDADLLSDSPSEVIRRFEVKKQGLESQKRVMEHEADLLVNYAKTLNGEHVNPTAMGDFLKTFVVKGRENLEAIAEIDKTIVEVNRMIEKELAKMAQKIGQANGQVTIVVVAAEDSKLEIKLTYIVSGAIWQPTYELHATTDNGKPSSSVSLHYRARIQQSTGEDWKNSALMLSTVASDMFAKTVPYLHMSKIEPGKPYQLFGPKNANNANTSIFSKTGPTNIFGQSQQQQQLTFGQQQQQQQQQQQSTFGQPSGAPAPATRYRSFGGLAPASSAPGSSPFGHWQPGPIPSASGPFGAGPPQPTAFGGGGSSSSGPSEVPAPGTGFSGPFGMNAPASSAPGGSLFGQPAFGGGASSSSGGFGGSSGLFGSSSPPIAVPHDTHAAHPEDDGLSTFEEITGPGPFSEPTTVVTESPLSVSYAVEGESTIPSDGVAHQVPVAVLTFDSKVTHVCCPKIEARVYLQCEVKNTSDFRLLPGPVSVFLDDSYVSKTSIQDINPSDTFDCTLGTDSATRLSYSRSVKTARSSGGTFAEVTNTTTYTNTTTIHNKHRFPLSEIIIRDVIPTAEDKRIKVLLRKPDGLVDAKDGQLVDLKNLKDGLKVRWSPLVDGKGGEKEGRFEFMWKVDAGAKVTVQSEWEVKTPADLAWHDTGNLTFFGR